MIQFPSASSVVVGVVFFSPQSFPNLTGSSDNSNKMLLQKQAVLHARDDYPGNFGHGCLNGILARLRSLNCLAMCAETAGFLLEEYLILYIILYLILYLMEYIIYLILLLFPI